MTHIRTIYIYVLYSFAQTVHVYRHGHGYRDSEYSILYNICVQMANSTTSPPALVGSPRWEETPSTRANNIMYVIVEFLPSSRC